MIRIRRPLPTDGPAIHDLIARCSPLDPNSLYCNLLQCSHFASTCILAEQDGRILSFISGYRLPEQHEVLFVWQVAVAPEARGQGLALRLLQALLRQPGCGGVISLQTTITPTNTASWALFQALARNLGASLAQTQLFDRATHFRARHESEVLVSIGPLQSIAKNGADQNRRTA